MLLKLHPHSSVTIPPCCTKEVAEKQGSNTFCSWKYNQKVKKVKHLLKSPYLLNTTGNVISGDSYLKEETRSLQGNVC